MSSFEQNNVPEELYSQSTILGWFAFLKTSKETSKETSQDSLNYNGLISILNELDEGEINFIVAEYFRRQTPRLEGGGGNSGAVAVVVSENIVTIKKEIPLLYRILFNGFIILSTFTILNLLFASTLKTTSTLIEMNFEILNDAVVPPIQETQLVELIKQLGPNHEFINYLNVLDTLHDNEDLLQLPSPDENDLNYEAIQPFINIYTQAKSFYTTQIKLPDFEIVNLIQTKITLLKEKSNPNKQSITENIMMALKGPDEVQKNFLIATQMLTVTTSLISAYSVKLVNMTTATQNISNLLWGLWWRLGIMMTITTYINKNGTKVLNLIQSKYYDNTMTLEKYHNMIETNKIRILKKINEEVGKHNISETDSKQIQDKIKKQISPCLITDFNSTDMSSFIKNLMGSAEMTSFIEKMGSNENANNVENGIFQIGYGRKTEGKSKRRKKCKTKYKKRRKITKKRVKNKTKNKRKRKTKKTKKKNKK
jgi:hypothetical protein